MTDAAEPTATTSSTPTADAGARRVHAVLYTYSSDAERVARVRPAHRDFLRGLLADGILLASGPWVGAEHDLAEPAADGLDDAPGALLLLRAVDVEECRRVLDADPFAAAGLVARRRVRAWDPVTGPWGS